MEEKRKKAREGKRGRAGRAGIRKRRFGKWFNVEYIMKVVLPECLYDYLVFRKVR